MAVVPAKRLDAYDIVPAPDYGGTCLCAITPSWQGLCSMMSEDSSPLSPDDHYL